MRQVQDWYVDTVADKYGIPFIVIYFFTGYEKQSYYYKLSTPVVLHS